MSTRELNVVAIQLSAPPVSTSHYLSHVDDVVRAAHRAQPTDVVVLPGGLTSRLSGRFEPEAALAVDGQPLELLCHLAKDLQCVLVGGFLAVRGRRIVDVTVIAEPTGRITLHDAARLPWRQLRRMAPGHSTGLGWIESLDDLRVGIASGLEWTDGITTADWLRSGVGLVLGGTGSCSSLGNGPFVVGSKDAWRSPAASEFGARRTALLTGVPTVLAARVGGSELTAICDGDGQVLASRCPGDGEGYVTATIAVKTDRPRRDLAPARASRRRRALATAVRGAAGLRGLTADVLRTGSRYEADLPDVRPGRSPQMSRETKLLEVRVESCEEIAAGVHRLKLVPVVETKLPAWEPGAHIDVVLPEGLGRRQYSLCGRPGDSSYEIAVLRSPDGRGGSVYLSEKVGPGDRLLVSHPRNHFPLLPAPHYVFVAGGIGITPILPMIRSLVSTRNASWHLFYGGRCESNMAFLEELSEYRPDHLTTFTDDRTGPIDLDVVRRSMRSSTAVYCCGPEALIAAVTDACGDHIINSERFARPPGDDLEPERDFTVVLARSGVSLRVPQHTSLLDALLDAGVEIDYACADGVCGSCELRVLQGTPSHRDAIYGGRPNAPDDRMLACVSRACSDSLTLDL